MKKILCILMCLLMFALGACSSDAASAEQNKPLKIWFHNDNGDIGTWCVVDNDTGVNYVVVSDGYEYAAITPISFESFSRTIPFSCV